MSNDISIASLYKRIDDMNQQAWEVRVNDSPKAFELSSESVKLSRGINYPKGLAEGLRSLGFCYIRLFKNEEATPLLKESLALFQSINDIKGQAVIYEYLGIIERNLGNLGHSLELLLKGNELVQQVGSIEVEITCCYQIGVTYKHLGNHENALDYLYRSLSLSENINLTLMVAYSTNIIGSIYFDNGNYEKALELYQQGLVIRRQSNDKWGEAGSLDNIGFTYLKLKQLDKAIEYCKQSLAISQSTGDKKGESNALLHLAEIYEQANDIKQASKFSNESLAIRKARGDKRGEAEVLLFLAELHKNRNDINDQQIFEWINGALNIANEIKSQDILSKACFNLHEYHQQKGNYKESLAQLETHLLIEKELHKNAITQKVSNLEISHKAEVISQRNKELTELNEQVNKANAELKIETSLERVRTTAMAMKKSADMLEICKSISNELALLDVKEIRNVQTAIFYEEKGSYMNYEYYAKHDKHFITDVKFSDHPSQYEFAYQMMKGPGEFFTLHLEAEKLKEWYAYQKTTEQFADCYLETASSLNYYWFSLGPVALGISTYFPLTVDQIELFKRFRNVFELTYRRYSDIEKAQLQAREAEIQLALERVRAKTMAMQKSEEFAEVAALLFEQVKSLGIETYASGFNIWDKEHNNLVSWMSNPAGSINPPFEMPIHTYDQHERIYQEWMKGELFVEDDLIGEDLVKHYKFLRSFPLLDAAFSRSEQIGIKTPDRQVHNNAYFSNGYLLFITLVPFPEAHDIFKRFAKVFDQTYTRFLDLQKAEAQARESQIQLALERVRARTMAMQKSEELPETSHVLFEQMKELGEPVEQLTIGVVQEENKVIEISATLHGDILKKVYLHSIDEPFMMRKIYNAWKNNQKTLIVELKGDELNAYNKYRNELTRSDMFPTDLGAEHRRIVYAAFFSKGMLALGANEPRPAESLQLLERFAGVFDQAYIRFIDLQKAEAQARESQIELALERVRARTMAMQKSEELADAAQILYHEFGTLGLASFTCGYSFIKVEKGIQTVWAVLPDGTLLKDFIDFPLEGDEVLNNRYNAWKNKEPLFVCRLEKEASLKHHEYLAKHVPREVAENFFTNLPDPWFFYSANFSNGYLFIITDRSFSHKEEQTIIRFAKVFEQTYTRFLDLQKAEAQAREAQIETALEKVRSTSLAMHRSDELQQVVVSLFDRLVELGIDFHGAGIYLFEKEKRNIYLWIASRVADPIKVNLPYDVDINNNLINQDLWKLTEKGEDVMNKLYSGQVKDDYFRYVSKYNESIIPAEVRMMMITAHSWIASFAVQKNCALVIDSWTGHLTSNEDFQIVKRFAKVFEQAYTRFLDLQKAEAQAREAKIEAALERIRSRAMAMQNSTDLNALISHLFEESTKLDLILDRCIVAIVDPQSLDTTWILSNPETPAEPTSHLVKYHEYRPYQLLLDAWKNRMEKFVYILEGEEKKNWDQFLFYKTELSELPTPAKEAMQAFSSVRLNISSSNFGNITLASFEPLTELQFDILIRFTKVFDLTYTRFSDLKQAEAQAREAKIEAALERVRSRTLAMQRSDELAETAAVMFQQLIHLGIEPNRLYIILLKEETGDMEAWVTDEDGSKVSRGFNGNFNRNETLHKMYAGWKQKNKTLVIDMQGEELQKYFHYLHDELNVPFKGGMEQKRRVQHIAYFSKGLIGIASPEPQPVETMQLLERFAAVFNLTYTRFNDLKIAEAHALQAEQDLIAIKEAKQKAEDALVELQSTQKQLIQTEKMASLGELTAGIAHEIQNPLNFVNNFSDVSNELIDEMKTELESGNTQEALQIANDVKDNLEKILHHGKRADAIVKGMLQHSRSSSGVKEPTDINNLADEYLRLAFHGYRAKDKSFNAKFETHFDDRIEKVNVIPQDIGRVILNLINNAFYTVNEKRKQTQNGYEPVVVVSTKRKGDKIEISVKDNGNGIPKKVLDKIFQPFFTTKPTGQGTGLGLSLSYDIITKGHAGELAVKTDEGKGAEFIISLPIN